jgi:hypothetical protein
VNTDHLADNRPEMGNAKSLAMPAAATSDGQGGEETGGGAVSAALPGVKQAKRTRAARRPKDGGWSFEDVHGLITEYLDETGPRSIWEVIQCFTSEGWGISEQTVIRVLWCMDMNGELDPGGDGLMMADEAAR